MSIPPICRRFEGKLIASCQAPDGDVFRHPESMARFAQACLAGGAAGIRANGAADIHAIRQVTDVPLIGIDKRKMNDGRILITPTLESARLLVQAGADAIALDVTSRAQQHGALARIQQIKTDLKVPVLADIATIEEALDAADAGADFVLSTLRGYTPDTAHITEFQPEFIADLARCCPVPVIAEGRIHSPSQARQAMAAGAWAVIVGTAITRPREIARSFAEAVDRQFRLRSNNGFFAGIDLGGTATKFGVVSSGGLISDHGASPTPALAGRDALLDHLKRTSEEVLRRAAGAHARVAALGVATAGWVNVDTGTVAYATDNLPGWTGTEIACELRKHVRIPIAVENDANALALAEKHFGAGRNLRDFISITLGTGVGGGCFAGGKLNRGAHWFANAIGHLGIVPDGLPCTCGQQGCLEVYSNASALMRYAGPEFSTPEAVIQSAHQGSTNAASAIRTLATYLGRGCAMLVQVFDPEAIIVSGGLAQNNPLLFECLAEYLSQHVPAWERRMVSVLASPLGYHGGVLGAAAIAMENWEGGL
jgi:N-acetylmannosamine-6-phosphate 2-epimerase / N-acetylmannosamine kinase